MEGKTSFKEIIEMSIETSLLILPTTTLIIICGILGFIIGIKWGRKGDLK